jgi:hypothetical protein
MRNSRAPSPSATPPSSRTSLITVCTPQTENNYALTYTVRRRRFWHCCTANNTDLENAQTLKLPGLSGEMYSNTTTNGDPTTTNITQHLPCI